MMTDRIYREYTPEHDVPLYISIYTFCNIDFLLGCNLDPNYWEFKRKCNLRSIFTQQEDFYGSGLYFFLLWEQENKSPAINIEETSIYF